MDCSTPDFPVHHSLPEFAQTHVHWVDDDIQPTPSLSPPSPPALNTGVFSSESALCIRWPSFGASASASYVLGVIVILSLSHVRLFVTSWTAARQAPLSSTTSRSLLKLMSIELVMPSNHLILCCPLLPLPSIRPSIRVFFNELALHIRWPKYWSFSFRTLWWFDGLSSTLLFLISWYFSGVLPKKQGPESLYFLEFSYSSGVLAITSGFTREWNAEPSSWHPPRLHLHSFFPIAIFCLYLLGNLGLE